MKQTNNQKIRSLYEETVKQHNIYKTLRKQRSNIKDKDSALYKQVNLACKKQLSYAQGFSEAYYIMTGLTY